MIEGAPSKVSTRLRGQELIRPYTVRTDYTQKVCFSATLGGEPEVEVRLG